MGNGFCLVFGAGQDRNVVKIQNFLHKPRQSRRVKNRRSKYEKNSIFTLFSCIVYEKYYIIKQKMHSSK